MQRYNLFSNLQNFFRKYPSFNSKKEFVAATMGCLAVFIVWLDAETADWLRRNPRWQPGFCVYIIYINIGIKELLKNIKKIFKKICRLEKSRYLCTRNWETNVLKHVSKLLERAANLEKTKFFQQKNEKSSQKIWWLRNFALPLHHFRVWNMTSERFENGSLIYWLYLREKM